MNWTDTKKKEWVDAGIMTFEHAYKMTFTQVKKKDTTDKKKAKQLVIKNRKRYIALWKSAIMQVIANSFDSRRKKFFDELPLSWRLKRMTYNHYKPVVRHHGRNLKKTWPSLTPVQRAAAKIESQNAAVVANAAADFANDTVSRLTAILHFCNITLVRRCIPNDELKVAFECDAGIIRGQRAVIMQENKAHVRAIANKKKKEQQKCKWNTCKMCEMNCGDHPICDKRCSIPIGKTHDSKCSGDLMCMFCYFNVLMQSNPNPNVDNPWTRPRGPVTRFNGQIITDIDGYPDCVTWGEFLDWLATKPSIKCPFCMLEYTIVGDLLQKLRWANIVPHQKIMPRWGDIDGWKDYIIVFYEWIRHPERRGTYFQTGDYY